MFTSTFEVIMGSILLWIMVYSIVSKVCDTVKACSFNKYCGVDVIKKGSEKLDEGGKSENRQ